MPENIFFWSRPIFLEKLLLTHPVLRCCWWADYQHYPHLFFGLKSTVVWEDEALHFAFEFQQPDFKSTLIIFTGKARSKSPVYLSAKTHSLWICANTKPFRPPPNDRHSQLSGDDHAWLCKISYPSTWTIHKQSKLSVGTFAWCSLSQGCKRCLFAYQDTNCLMTTEKQAWLVYFRVVELLVPLALSGAIVSWG